MKKKKLTSLILAACLTLTALTGCGRRHRSEYVSGKFVGFIRFYGID